MVSRGAGRSAVAASAYLSCSRLYNDYDGIQHDYTKKRGLVWQEVFLPKCAPQEWQDREKLWNAVEEVETAKDSRLAREFVVALPIELNREEQIELLQEFIQDQFVADGMCADAAIHDTDGHNPHAHILLTVRPLDEQGKWQYKTEKEYLCILPRNFSIASAMAGTLFFTVCISFLTVAFNSRSNALSALIWRLISQRSEMIPLRRKKKRRFIRYPSCMTFPAVSQS